MLDGLQIHGHKIYEHPTDYDTAIHNHPFYKEMKKRMFEIAKERLDFNSRMMEYGAGTGNLTAVMACLPFKYFLVTEPDDICLRYLQEKLGSNPRLTFDKRDITNFSTEDPFDVIVSCAVDHHVHPSKKTRYLEIIRSQLKSGGLFIAGEELLNPFDDENSRIRALYDYHGTIIRMAIEEGHFDTAQSEAMALMNGIDEFDEFKIPTSVYFDNIEKAGLELQDPEKIGPDDGQEHGVYVVVAKRP